MGSKVLSKELIRKIIQEELYLYRKQKQLDEDFRSNIVAAAIAAASFFGGIKAQTTMGGKGVDTVQQAKKDSLIVPIGTSFKSGTYSFKSTEEVENKLKQIGSFIQRNPQSNFEIKVISSESQVPNRDAEKPGNPRLEVGQLAQKRADAAQLMVKTFIEAAKKDGFLKGDVSISEPKILVGDEKYTPGDNVNDNKFTKDQYVNISIKLTSNTPPIVKTSTDTYTGDGRPKYIINIRGDESGFKGIYLLPKNKQDFEKITNAYKANSKETIGKYGQATYDMNLNVFLDNAPEEIQPLLKTMGRWRRTKYDSNPDKEKWQKL
jgi:hypothetical protein